LKACVIIPALNAGKTIFDLATKLLAMGHRVVVVDDGSTDDTYQEAKRAGAMVIKHGANRGKGAALKTGFSYVLEGGYEAVITIDADGQHSYEDVSKFLSAAGSDADIIIGSRMGDTHDMPPIRILTNKLSSFIISRLTGERIEDSQCGFRLIKSHALRGIKLATNGYDTESELLIKAARAGFTISTVQVKTIYTADRVSHINPFLISFRFLRLLWRSLWWKNPSLRRV
jgi:glycosyltransferase involved in cell wall biosynthesis